MKSEPMDWIPDWFRVSSEYVYALAAFLGSVTILHWERYLDRRERRQQRKLDDWSTFHDLSVDALEQLNLATNSRANRFYSEMSAALSRMSTIQSRYGSLMSRSRDKNLHDACLSAMKTTQEFVETFNSSEDELTPKHLVDQFTSNALNSAGVIMSLNVPYRVILRSRIATAWQKITKRSSDTIATDEQGDTPPAAT